MKKHTVIYLLIVALFALQACNRAAQREKKSAVSVQQIMVDKLGEGAVSQKNASGDFLLCRQPKSAPQNHFFIYDLKKGKIIFEDTIVNGTVEWLSENDVVVKITPGMVTQDPEMNKLLTGYIFNVLQKKKQPR